MYHKTFVHHFSNKQKPSRRPCLAVCACRQEAGQHFPTDGSKVDSSVVVVREGIEVCTRCLGRLRHLPVEKLLHFGETRLVKRLPWNTNTATRFLQAAAAWWKTNQPDHCTDFTCLLPLHSVDHISVLPLARVLWSKAGADQLSAAPYCEGTGRLIKLIILRCFNKALL